MKPQTRLLQRRLGMPSFARVWRGLAVIVLVLGGIGPLAPALAQGTEGLRVAVANPPTTICTKQTARYRVQVLDGLPREGAGAEDAVVLMNPGVVVAGQVSDASIGDFVNAQTIMRPIPGFNLRVPDAVEFTFVAKNKPGRAVLTFGATVDGRLAATFPVNIVVQPCKLTAMTITRWVGTTPYGTMKVMAATEQVAMTPDDDGHYFGSGRVVYLVEIQTGGCPDAGSIGIGKVKFNADMDEAGQLAVRVEYDKTALMEVASCGTGAVSSVSAAEEGPLRLTTPFVTSVIPQTHELKADGGVVPPAGPGHLYLIVGDEGFGR